MKKMAWLVAVALVACGGSGGNRAPTTSPMSAQNESLPDSDTAAYPSREPTPEPVPEPEPAPPPEPEPVVAAPITATAELLAIKNGTSMGTVTFEVGEAGQVTIRGEFTGLKKKAPHAFYVHEKGDCSKKGKAAGGHLNPTKAKHGPPASSARHAGDFGDLSADDAGNAAFSMTTDSVTLEAGRPDSVLDRAIVIHSKKDDRKGDGGPALACGVIRLTSPAPEGTTTPTPTPTATLTP